MPIIQWTEKFNINISEIDDQHKKWVSIYNKAHDRMMTQGEEGLASTGIDALREMREYGLYHFAKEEEIMAKLGIPWLETHRAIHKDFSREIKVMIHDIESGKHVLNSEIIKRVENWLISHILDEDRKIIPFLENQSD